jgi:hypothetical protein
MRTHIKVVALINIVFGALGALAGVAVLIGGTFGSLFSGSFVGAVAGTAVSVTVGLVLACLALISVVAGFGLLNGQSWARYVLIVVSIIRLFRFPIGTAFGIYSLWVLFHRETQQIFDGTAATV